MEIKSVLDELASHPEGSFFNINSFNQHSISACNIKGVSPLWEMHPDTDEWFYILEGKFEITLLMPDCNEHYEARAGSSLVVPKGVWHKPAAPHGTKFLYHTPGTTLHSELADPRKKN